MKIVILGFDHGMIDRRIVLKDIKYFVNRGYKVKYIYRDNNKSEIQNLPIELKNHVNFISIKKEASGILSRKKFEDEIIKESLRDIPNYFYLHGMFITFPISRLKSLKKIAKVIYDEHEYPPEPIAINNRLLKNIIGFFINIRDRMLINYINHSFCVSKSIQEHMENIGFKNVQLKPNVSEETPLEPINFEKRKNILIVAGALQIERGPFKILNIFKELQKNIPQLELHMHVKFGSITLENEVKEYINKNQLENIYILPLIEYSKLISKITHSLGVFMSFPNGIWKTNYVAMPNRFYDSLVSGTPIIASKDSIDVANEVENFNLGINFDYNNFDNSIQTLTSFLTNKEIYNHNLNNIYEYAKNNTWNKVSKVLDKVFI